LGTGTTFHAPLLRSTRQRRLCRYRELDSRRGFSDSAKENQLHRHGCGQRWGLRVTSIMRVFAIKPCVPTAKLNR
jgi:hypothetical protein